MALNQHEGHLRVTIVGALSIGTRMALRSQWWMSIEGMLLDPNDFCTAGLPTIYGGTTHFLIWEVRAAFGGRQPTKLRIPEGLIMNFDLPQLCFLAFCLACTLVFFLDHVVVCVINVSL